MGKHRTMEGLEAVLDRHQFNDSRENSRWVAGGGDDNLHTCID